MYGPLLGFSSYLWLLGSSTYLDGLISLIGDLRSLIGDLRFLRERSLLEERCDLYRPLLEDLRFLDS